MNSILSCFIFFLGFASFVSADAPDYQGDTPLIKEITQSNFESIIASFTQHSWVIIFYHPECPQCGDLQQVFDEVAARFVDTYIFGYVRSDNDPDIVKQFQVVRLPGLVLLHQESDAFYKYRGELNVEDISAFITTGFKELIGVEEVSVGFFENLVEQLGFWPLIGVFSGMVLMTVIPCISDFSKQYNYGVDDPQTSSNNDTQKVAEPPKKKKPSDSKKDR